jgi:hypothetical protein
MNDDLAQLLRRADASAPAPSLDSSDLPIRRTIRRQRTIAACGLALLLVMSALLPILLRPTSLSQPVASVQVVPTDTDLKIHEKTALLLEQFQSRQEIPARSDDFLNQLQMQRNRAALVLLRSANRELANDETQSATAMLKRTIALFPDTTAAVSAGRQLEQLTISRRQS